MTPLGISQSDKFLKDVAIGSKGVVEHLLCLIKDKLEEAKKQEKKEMEQGIEYSYSEEGNFIKVVEEKKNLV